MTIYTSLSCKKPPAVVKSILTRSLQRMCPDALYLSLTLHTSPLQSHSPFPSHTFIATSPTSETLLCPCPANIYSIELALTLSITSAFNESAPLRRATLSTRRKPWVSPQIRALMKTASSLGSADDLARFLLQAKVSNQAPAHRDSTSVQGKWRELRNLHSTSPTLPFSTFDAATLNAQFAFVANRHPPVNESDFEAAAGRSLNPRITGYFDLRSVSEHHLEIAIKSSSSQATGWGGLSIPMLKLAAPVIIDPLTTSATPSLVIQHSH